MKRSDMIDKLSELLDEHTDTSSSCCNLGLSTKNLGKVIDGLIKAGMLPPSTNLSHISAIDNSWEPETCGSCEIPCNTDWCCTKDNDE